MYIEESIDSEFLLNLLTFGHLIGFKLKWLILNLGLLLKSTSSQLKVNSLVKSQFDN